MRKRVKKISTYYDEPFQSECSLDKDLELHLANEKKEKEHLNADVEYYMYITRVEKREEIINKINLDEIKFLIENFKEEKIIKHLYEIIESIVLA
ncbi:hypothetical protein GKD08_02380 [Paeniclostridium sordellii]|uniref:hypothetical protein n=1 Tax=Paraclostridium sordellii TaxID=1505 RepID=UPI0012B04118|nr:hypothetical protein [Paeniclostridium sordellii]MDU4414961.1 hypothetical protein [Paeniclostridium sordellii]MRZ27605.1 hypothetical protein [Paeniclostridium sordellii]